MSAGVMTWAVAVPLASFLVYRRVRRNFGRQPLRTGRLAIRSLFLAIVAGMLLLSSMAGGIGASMASGGVLAGLAAGALIGVYGVRMTKFETVEGRHWYTPHPGIGLGLTALMLGRLVYRFFAVRATAATIAGSDVSVLANLQRSPLTLAFAGLLIGYYLAFNVGLLRMARHDDLNAVEASPE